jgi:hypothetical protein
MTNVCRRRKAWQVRCLEARRRAAVTAAGCRRITSRTTNSDPRSRPELYHRDGDTAIVAVSLEGAAASLGSESEALTYSAGRWGLVPNDLSLYKHGSVKTDIAAAKATGYCAGR